MKKRKSFTLGRIAYEACSAYIKATCGGFELPSWTTLSRREKAREQAIAEAIAKELRRRDKKKAKKK